MKKLILLLGIVILSCNPQTEKADDSAANQAKFEQAVATWKTFPESIADRDLDKVMSIFADSLKWYGPDQKTSDAYASKADLRTALEGYLSMYNESSFKNGNYYGGNLYSMQGDVSDNPNATRIYGDWHHTHMESGTKVSHKWMAVLMFNEDGQAHTFMDYFDVGGFLTQHIQE